MSSTHAKVAAAKLRAMRAEAAVAEADKKAAAILAALRRAELEYELALAADADVDERSSSAAAAGSKVAMNLVNAYDNTGVESCFSSSAAATKDAAATVSPPGLGKESAADAARQDAATTASPPGLGKGAVADDSSAIPSWWGSGESGSVAESDHTGLPVQSGSCPSDSVAALAMARLKKGGLFGSSSASSASGTLPQRLVPPPPPPVPVGGWTSPLPPPRCCFSSSTADPGKFSAENPGGFMEFGRHVRLRFWYLCLSGSTDPHCGLVTWSDDYGVWWEKKGNSVVASPATPTTGQLTDRLCSWKSKMTPISCGWMSASGGTATY